jgi:hypothetical protein
LKGYDGRTTIYLFAEEMPYEAAGTSESKVKANASKAGE